MVQKQALQAADVLRDMDLALFEDTPEFENGNDAFGQLEDASQVPHCQRSSSLAHVAKTDTGETRGRRPPPLPGND